MGGALEGVEFVFPPVVDAAEKAALAERPVDGAGSDAEDVFQFIQQLHGLAGGAVHLVHEGEDRHAAAAADFEELAGLAFDSLAGIDDHDGGVDGGEDAVGIFREVLVAGGVEEIHHAAAVFELQDGGGDGNAALAFQFHPVGGGGALVLAGGDTAGELHGTAVEEELFRERGLPGIRVGDDGKGAAAGDFFSGSHEGRLLHAAAPASGNGRCLRRAASPGQTRLP